MKKIVLFLLTLVVSIPVFASEYACKIKEGSSLYYYIIEPAETPAKYCGKQNMPNTPDYAKCMKIEYPKVINAYKLGNCERLAAPTVYNINGCKCESKSLKDGTILHAGCSNDFSNPRCDVEASQQILEKMLYKF